VSKLFRGGLRHIAWITHYRPGLPRLPIKSLLSLATAFTLSCAPFSYAADAPSLPSTASALLTLMRAEHFHPAELDTETYRAMENGVMDLARSAASPEEFLEGFNKYWRGGLYSHVRLYYRPPASAGAPRNNPPVQAPDPVTLAWDGDVAILTVNSMSGSSDQIDAAYDEIAERGATKLIINLRANGGGAFGVMPLVGHLIDQTLDMGVFVTNRWYEDHDSPPTADDLRTAAPCQCSDAAFAADMETRPLTSYRVEPMAPHFSGPVYVLTSRVSISAAEIAIEALQASGRATIVGEKTPGLLLQPKFFTLDGGFQLMWPIGDYRTVASGRIEGVGIRPDVELPAVEALEAAMKL
jgi:carboxyl-terminal processing protease